MVTRLVGNLKPELVMAARTRSRDSLMDLSAKPTMLNAGKPLVI